MSDSPLAMAEPFSESEITSAPQRLAASSKETAVRVEASKKARQTVFPASEFVRLPPALDRASSSTERRSPRVASSSVKKFLVMDDDHPILPVGLPQVHEHPLLARGRHVLAHAVGPDRQLPVPPVYQDGEPDRSGALQFQESVHRDRKSVV